MAVSASQTSAHVLPSLGFCNIGEFIESLHADDTTARKKSLRRLRAEIGGESVGGHCCREIRPAPNSPSVGLLAIELPVSKELLAKNLDAGQR
jgi:hypothetical protein